MEKFLAAYIKKTAKSKHLTQQYRPILADFRVSSGFNLSFKEIFYPIVAKRSLGSRIWDVDGNEYIDLMMGLGVNLFGHNPPFIKEVLQEQLEKGIQLGPQSDIAGEVAELICEFTGMERVTFSNTGTEAVMTAIRLARTVTGRNKIALFSGSYHGHSNETLVKKQKIDGNLHAVPIAPGIPANITEDVLVLDYDNPESLSIIQAHEQELASVLVVPVQTLRPDLQPKVFLQQLRQLTEKAGIALICDEMVTGFRVHPGGAQGWFGIKADIATYGKVVGGGMPIGIIAGKATYMDAIDGGMWNYGDDSSPTAKTTFFAGTFCKHPLAMASARAVLKYLKIQGESLYNQLNQRTSEFVTALNVCFEKEELPMRMANFGSLFGPASEESSTSEEISATSQSMDLLRYYLLSKGVYSLRAGGFLSTAHTDEDISYVIEAVKESIGEFREAGFLPVLMKS